MDILRELISDNCNKEIRLTSNVLIKISLSMQWSTVNQTLFSRRNYFTMYRWLTGLRRLIFVSWFRHCYYDHRKKAALLRNIFRNDKALANLKKFWIIYYHDYNTIFKTSLNKFLYKLIVNPKRFVQQNLNKVNMDKGNLWLKQILYDDIPCKNLNKT